MSAIEVWKWRAVQSARIPSHQSDLRWTCPPVRLSACPPVRLSACLTLAVLALSPAVSPATPIEIVPGVQITYSPEIDNTGLAGYGFTNRPNTWAAIGDLQAQSPGLAFTDNSFLGAGTPVRGDSMPLYNLDMFDGGAAWNPNGDSVVWTGYGYTSFRPTDGREGIVRQTYTNPAFGASWVEHPGGSFALSYDAVGGEIFAGFFVLEDFGNHGAVAELVGLDELGNVIFDYTTPRAGSSADWLDWSNTTFLSWVISDPDLGLSSILLYTHQWTAGVYTDYTGIAMTGFSYTAPTDGGGPDPIPEPASIALLALGLAGLGAGRRSVRLPRGSLVRT